jgi:hypothetical protein
LLFGRNALRKNILGDTNQKLMPIIELTTEIKSTIEICFDLSRSIDLHKISTAYTNEEAIAG